MRRNILISDDDPDFRALLRTYLEPSGYIVNEVPDGYETMEELQQNQYDLLILDISMPHWNGFKVLKMVRNSEKFKNLPVIMLTGSDERDHLLRACTDVNDYLLKPPRRGDLLARIERILGGRPQFEEIRFPENAPNMTGSLTVPLRLLSISLYGMTFASSVALDRNFTLAAFELSLFAQLQINHRRLSVRNCVAQPNGGYEVFVPFLGLTEAEQKRVHDWIQAETYNRKIKAA
jgi:two-component system alkaline phosphatase synthesis response regulator PhoP